MEAIVIFVVLIVIGLVVGRENERKHFRELAANEDSLRDIAASQRARRRRRRARSAAARSSWARS